MIVTLVVTTLDRLGRSTIDMLGFAAQLRNRSAGLRVLNLGGGDVDTATPMGSMVFSVMAALAQMELEIKRERVRDSFTKRRNAGQDLGGRRAVFTVSQVRAAIHLFDAGEPAAQVARDLGMSRATLCGRPSVPGRAGPSRVRPGRQSPSGRPSGAAGRGRRVHLAWSADGVHGLRHAARRLRRDHRR
jgi:DNA invertase Pin-like site-specific DNA recombinase